MRASASIASDLEAGLEVRNKEREKKEKREVRDVLVSTVSAALFLLLTDEVLRSAEGKLVRREELSQKGGSLTGGRQVGRVVW
jgi:hypothetical protein